MPDKFNELIRNIQSDDKNAISSIRKNIETIVSNYLSKKYIEIDWIAHEKGHYCINEFYDEILSVITSYSIHYTKLYEALFFIFGYDKF